MHLCPNIVLQKNQHLLRIYQLLLCENVCETGWVCSKTTMAPAKEVSVDAASLSCIKPQLVTSLYEVSLDNYDTFQIELV